MQATESRFQNCTLVAFSTCYVGRSSECPGFSSNPQSASDSLSKYGISQKDFSFDDIMARLLAIRQSQNMTQQEFADRLGFLKRTYLTWERGESEPPLRLLVALVREFGIDANWLLEGPGSVPISKGASMDWQRAKRLYKELKNELDSVGLYLDPEQFFEYLEIIFAENPNAEEIVKRSVVKWIVSRAKT